MHPRSSSKGVLNAILSNQMWQVVHFMPDQLSRLHMILKPFMLRRIKRDVENELSEKVKYIFQSYDTIQFVSHEYASLHRETQRRLSTLLQIEIKVICELTSRQKWLYRAIRNKISIEDLVQTSTSTSASSSATNNLMNIVMQFRKVRMLERGCTALPNDPS